MTHEEREGCIDKRQQEEHDQLLKLRKMEAARRNVEVIGKLLMALDHTNVTDILPIR